MLSLTAGMYYFIFFLFISSFLTNTYHFPSFHCCVVSFPFHFTALLSLFPSILPLYYLFFFHSINMLFFSFLFHCCVALLSSLFLSHYHFTFRSTSIIINYYYSIITSSSVVFIICHHHHHFTLHSLSSSLFCYP